MAMSVHIALHSVNRSECVQMNTVQTITTFNTDTFVLSAPLPETFVAMHKMPHIN